MPGRSSLPFRFLAVAVSLLVVSCALRAPQEKGFPPEARPPQEVSKPEPLPVLEQAEETTPRTPGTRVPAMVLKDWGVNPTVETAAEPLSTFAADVDTASYAL
ncbi:MAG: von Willebrand factor type A domain-containing protein, partial [Myxococcaceae bacterium]|nr:von Willebrand factor type A domain-containing protein [Myxococcaceae bacterium]